MNGFKWQKTSSVADPISPGTLDIYPLDEEGAVRIEMNGSRPVMYLTRKLWEEMKEKVEAELNGTPYKEVGYDE